MDIEEHWRREYRIELDTPRLRLRSFIAGDVDWIADLLTDSEVNRFLWDGASTVERARRTAKAFVDLDQHCCMFGYWAVQDKTTGVIHGWTELSKLRPWSGPSDEIALSYVLGRASWGRGIATEAAGRLLRHAFEIHQLDRVMAVIMAANTASRRVLEKLGMRFVKSEASRTGRALEYFGIDAPASGDPCSDS